MEIFAAETSLIGAIAAFSSLLGVAMAILSHVSTRRNAAEQAQRECHEQLLAEQRVSERLSTELHELRMKYGEAGD